MMRWDIINHLIKVNNYKTYLEIGYYKGWSFDRIQCGYKTAVDPNPSKTDEQVNMPRGSLIGLTETIVKMTSDDFFKYHPSDVKYDIIFIDGLHESSQVDRDIKNALEHLNSGGTIVMHDCNPSSYEMTTTGTQSGEWTGDVYKSFIKFRYFGEPFYYSYVVDTDYGVGIIRAEAPEYASEICCNPASIRESIDSWELFDKNRRLLLNLKSPEEFLKYNETTTDNKLPA